MNEENSLRSTLAMQVSHSPKWHVFKHRCIPQFNKRSHIAPHNISDLKLHCTFLRVRPQPHSLQRNMTLGSRNFGVENYTVLHEPGYLYNTGRTRSRMTQQHTLVFAHEPGCRIFPDFTAYLATRVRSIHTIPFSLQSRFATKAHIFLGYLNLLILACWTSPVSIF